MLSARKNGVEETCKMIPVSMPQLSGNEEKYVLECLKSGWISSAGSFVTRFEEAYANYIGTKYATSCSNGTAALHLALLACGVGPGDEVIIPDLTFAATANAVLYCGAKPVLVDVEEKTWNIDPVLVENVMTSKTKAIIAVHLYGNPCDMDALMAIAERHKVYVIEDAAEAHGAVYRGRKVGGIGHIGCFSFYGNKILTTGEGGMCVTNDKKLLDTMELCKNHGMKKERRYFHEVIGFNYRLTNIQAAIGLAQLEQLPAFIKERSRVTQQYQKSLAGKKLPLSGIIARH
jgi:perosamine synthetase